MSTNPDWLRDTARLLDGYRQANGYDMHPSAARSVGGEGGFVDVAFDALGFDEEHFQMQDSQTISCRRCGGLFKDLLWVARHRRLACGW